LNEKASFQGIVATFDLVSPRKISQILPVFQYNSSISIQSHDILANYVASSVQWYKCYGTFRPRGNTKKFKTPDEMISKTQLKDSDYSDDGSDFTVGDRSSRRHKTHEPKQEKHQMTSRQDSATTKMIHLSMWIFPWITNLLLKISVTQLMKSNGIHPLEP
jgi:hypothetical protein